MNKIIDDFFNNSNKVYEFMFIDSPENYSDPYKKEGAWLDTNYLEVFESIPVDTLFIWTTLDRLPVVLSAYLESEYDLKGASPCYRIDKTEDIAFSLKTKFHNAPTYLLMLQKPNSGNRFNYLMKSIILERNKSLDRPSEWEKSLFFNLCNDSSEGAYLLPTGEIVDISDMLNITHESVEEVQLF